MFSHICLGTNNLSESIKFYDQVMSKLNVHRQETEETYACYGDKKDVGSGGVYNGAPGLRDVHPNFYAAYILDPTGNKLVVVCHSDGDN